MILLLGWSLESCLACATLLGHEIQLFVHLLFNQTDLILLKLILGNVFTAWVEDIHCLKVEGTDATHERFLQVLLHVCLLIVALVDLICSVVQAPPQHLNLLAIIRAYALNLRLDRLLEVFFLFLLSPNEMGFDPSLPERSHSLFLVISQAMCNHLS